MFYLCKTLFILIQIHLYQYNYTPESGVILTWGIAPGPSFTCDAIFVYESKLYGHIDEVLLDSNPVRCPKKNINKDVDKR